MIYYDRQLYLINDFTIVEFNKELKVITSLYKNLKSKTQELTFTNNTYSDKGKSKFQNYFIVMEVRLNKQNLTLLNKML